MKILVIDSHEYFRKTLVSLLKDLIDIKAIKEASTTVEGVEMVKEFSPEIVIMDIKMPGTHEFEIAGLMKTINPDVKIVLYSMYDLEIFEPENLRIADAMIQKDRLFEELEETIKGLYTKKSS